MDSLEIVFSKNEDHYITVNFDPAAKLQFSGTDRWGDHDGSESITMAELLKLIKNRDSWMGDKAKEFNEKIGEWQKACAEKNKEITHLKLQIGKLKDAIKILKETE